MISLLPLEYLFYKLFQVSFFYQYDLVEGNSCYTNDYKYELSKSLVNTTVKPLTDTFKIPYSTGERFIKQHLV